MRYFRRFPGHGWAVRVWRLSVAWIPDAWEREYVPPSERYGSGWTWTLGRLRVRFHGSLYRRFWENL